MSTLRRQRVVMGGACLLFLAGLAALSTLVPLGHPHHLPGGVLFYPVNGGGLFGRFPLEIAVPWAGVFLVGLLDWQRPARIEHLDLLALALVFPAAMLIDDGLSAAGLFLSAACLLWLFVRLAGVWWGTFTVPSLRPAISGRKLAAAVMLMLVARLLVTLVSGTRLDVGGASAIGALRLLHGVHLYGGSALCRASKAVAVHRCDSYGPVAYYTYMPFLALTGSAAKMASTMLPAIFFDLALIVGLDKLGRKLGGEALAHSFVYVYLIYPFAALAMLTQTNDTLIAALVVWALFVLERPAARAVLLVAAALTKFLPALLLLQFLGRREGRRRYIFWALAALIGFMAYPLLSCGPVVFWERTFGFQGSRGLQFSFWYYIPGVAAVARPLLGAGLVALALSPLWHRRPFDPRSCAALAAALLIGAQLLLGYWFYTYIVWFFPLLVVAFVSAPRGADPAGAPAVE